MIHASPGRNDPCPCGSGRKFKHCCPRAFAAEDHRRQRLRDAEGAVVPTLFSYALDRWGRRFFEEAWEEFFVWDRVPTDVEHSPEFHTLFFPWFVFSFVPDPASPDPIPDAPREPVALAYLADASVRTSDFEQRFVRAAAASAFSFLRGDECGAGPTHRPPRRARQSRRHQSA
jgi:hypothetical protein